MNVRRAGLLVAVLSALLVLVLTMALARRQSPGRVATVHGRIEALAGGEACSQCHGGWFGDMPSACNECHTEIAAQLQDRRGLHGALAPELATTCSTCHSEHHGDEFQLVNRLAFAQAGIADVGKFDHELVGFTMAGAHLRVECSKCHRYAEAEVLPEDTKRYLGLRQDCATCHPDPHEGRMHFACTTCHSQETFVQRVVPDHERWLEIDGSHAKLACRDCHAQDGAHALERLHPGSERDARGCADCHQSPHGDAFVQGNATALGATATKVCAACHFVAHQSFGDRAVTLTPEQHRHGGFALAAPHERVFCQQCHPADQAFSERHPGRTQRDCRACHGDPHQGQFASGPYADGGCVGCHADTHFAPHEFDRQHHARTALPLDGKHAELECRECHADPAEGTPRTFHGTPNRCEGCHADAHVGGFAAARERLLARPRGTCIECHGTTAWGEVDHARFDHGGWTGFALAGAHAEIVCTDCHAPTAEPDETHRRFGRVPVRAAAQPECVRCHGDPHEGVFDRDGVPATVDGRVGCLRCHDTASFRALPHGYDHAAFAGFELRGRHGELDCTACHAPLAAPTDTGRTWGHAAGSDCAACHADPHRKQFERLGKTDCERCHKSATTFATLSFRHNLDSRFPIEEQHAKVACAGCHKPETDNRGSFVRYKPLPVDCVGCHGREEGGAPSRRRRR